MNANELADWLQDKTIYLWDSGDEQYYASPICEDIVPMLRQQQAEIEVLKADKLEYAEEVLEALNWGNYAGDYFQQKHGWYDDVAKWNGIVESLKKAQEK